MAGLTGTIPTDFKGALIFLSMRQDCFRQKKLRGA
jgi:hypothetical protein